MKPSNPLFFDTINPWHVGCHNFVTTRHGIFDNREEFRLVFCCTATVETIGPTGVEKEALMAVQVALLTVYDMCKALDRGTTISGIKLLEKHGGKSGSFVAG